MIRKYQKGDALKVCAQDEQKAEASAYAAFFDDINAYSQVNKKGEITAVCGFGVEENGMAVCYALLGKNCGKNMIELVRFWQKEIPKMIKIYQFNRVVMTVRVGFTEGERLAKLLGFYATEVLQKFYLGNDYQLYERK